MRVAIVGIGQMARVLEGCLSVVKDAPGNTAPPGSSYIYEGVHPKDFKVVAAFDVDEEKTDTSYCGVPVLRGEVFETPAGADFVPSVGAGADVVKILRDTQCDMLICMITPGSPWAYEYYAHAALSAGCAFLAFDTYPSTQSLEEEFENANIPFQSVSMTLDPLSDGLRTAILNYLSNNSMVAESVFASKAMPTDSRAWFNMTSIEVEGNFAKIDMTVKYAGYAAGVVIGEAINLLSKSKLMRKIT